MSALNRMILWELVRVFAFALIGVTGIFLIGGVIQTGSQLGLGPAKILQVIPLLVPSFLPYTIPATVLFATCVAYGRLSNDNEIVAIKAAGIDLYRILWPAVVLGVGATAAVLAISHTLIPRTQLRLQEEITKDPEEFLYNQLKRDRLFRAPTADYSLYVRDVQGKRLIDVIIKRKGGVEAVPGLGGRVLYDYVARAPEAEIRVDLNDRKLIVDAKNLVVYGGNGSTISSGAPPIRIDLPELVSAEELRTRPLTMSWDRLLDRAAQVRADREALLAKREATRQAAAAESDPAVQAQVAAQDPAYAQQIKDMGRTARNFEYEYHARPALAFSCLAFALIGCPVGVWFNRSDYLSTFVVCWIPTVTIYFPIFFAGGGLAKEGRIPMPVGVWAADVVVGILALMLVRQLIRR